MTRFGYTLSSDEHPPNALVDNATRAEAAGFDFVSISDHFHPWVSAQAQPFRVDRAGRYRRVHRTHRRRVGVWCPTTRIHPAIIAPAAAATSLLMPGRYFLGVGTGEALNEHILGHRWPRPEVRRAMLPEAVDMRALWTGDTLDHHGDFYDVDNARLFDPPGAVSPIIVSGFGDILDSVRQFGDAGYDHLYSHQIGPDQYGFLDFWTTTLQPALTDLDTPSA